MPLTAKGEKIKAALEEEYGAEKGERVLYAGKNKGTFRGIDSAVADACQAMADQVEAINRRMDAYDDRQARSDARRWPSYTLSDLEAWLSDGRFSGDKLRELKQEIEDRRSGKSQTKVTPQIEGGKPMTKVGRL